MHGHLHALSCRLLNSDGCAGFAGGKAKDGTFRDPVTEALLRRAAEGQLGTGALGAEADRTRLIPVAQKLVELGASLETQDAEGRTALHLAAGCGDRAMVLKLIEVGADVNCHDGVGGEFTQKISPLSCPKGSASWPTSGTGDHMIMLISFISQGSVCAPGFLQI